jgi:cell division protein FtsB
MLSRRWIPTLLLMLLLLVLQAQLWFGRGSLPEVSSMRAQLDAMQAQNAASRLRNAQIASEVRDLEEGLDMVEELARMELGMVKPNEIFVQMAQPRP